MMKKLLLFISCFLLLTGCNYRELNEMAIISAMSVQKVEEGYEVVAQVMNPSANKADSSSNMLEFLTYTQTAATLQEAFRDIVLESPWQLYGSHVQILLINESLAKDGMEDIFDFFFRHPEIRKEFYVLVEKDNTNQDLEILTSLVELSSSNIYSSLETAATTLGNVALITFNDLMDMYLNENLEIVLPSLELIGEAEEGKSEDNITSSVTKASLRLNNMAIFKDNKLLGYLTEEESIAFNFIQGEIDHTLVQVFEEDCWIVEEVLRISSDVAVDVDEKEIKISIKGNGSLNECTCDYDLTDVEVLKEINKKLNQKIEDMILNSVFSINETYNSDIYGFRDMFYKKDPKAYKKLKDNWYEENFPNLKISVSSEVNLIEKGSLLGGIYG